LSPKTIQLSEEKPMHKKMYTLMAILLMSAMVLGACAPTTTPTPEAPAPATPEPQEPVQPPAATVKACQVTDTGGVDDRSFNETAWNGVLRAQSELGVEGKVLESQQQSDYEQFINAFVEEGCDLIVTVGFLLGDATEVGAQQNPDQNFAIVDYAYDPGYDNVLGLVFATEQAGFLAGYLAAGVTQTGIIGTFGGIQIPPVTVFMDGYALGAQEYNRRHGTDVQVLGWDPASQSGLFVGNFESLDDGRTMGETLIAEGADIIMPVAGPVGQGTARAAMEHGDVWIIGVDTDWTVSVPEFTPVMLTSVLKNMDVAVFEAIELVVEGNFSGGLFVGTLENDGVGLAPYHDLANLVPSGMDAELEEIRQALISGELSAVP
jgi:basic membrane protein A and related proteins